MKQPFISLLYPDEETALRHALPNGRPRISEDVSEELGLTAALGLRGSSPADYFTMELPVIQYRERTLDDMLAHPEIGEALNGALPILYDITELRALDRDMGSSSGESYLYSITEIELYVSVVDLLYKGLSPFRDEVTSDAFRSLIAFLDRLVESEYYRELNERLRQLSSRVREIRSITVGVNLDAELRPSEAAVISINAEPFKSGKILDKILRMSFRNDAMTTIAPLTPFGRGQSENRREALVSAFNSAIEEVFRSSVRAWRTIVGEYVLENTDFLLKLLPEIEFVTKATRLMRRLADKGCPLANPSLFPAEEKRFSAVGLYNPDVALRIEDEIVSNDFAFDDLARIYVLTGPNRGGKSVITCAVGLAQSMAQLGLRVPAVSAEISPVDGIFTHFPEGADDTIDKGRLGEECARLREIFDSVSADSLVLLDESLSSTGAYEASYIGEEILAGFSAARCRGIFSTHLHELAAAVPGVNERVRGMGGVMIDTLVAGIEEGRRSFKIHRMKPDGKSYARDIADKYGLSLEEITRRMREGASENA
jgi:hypothetical protein